MEFGMVIKFMGNIDRTLLIKEFLDRRPLVSLFVSPNNLAKTQNMSMLKLFFEISDKDTSIYFQNKNIWSCGENYKKYQGTYPVIFLSFQDLKYDSWEATMKSIKAVLRDEFVRHSALIKSDKMADYEKVIFDKLIVEKATDIEITFALKTLSRMLYKHYSIAPIVIIEEYDAPIMAGHIGGYIDEIATFMSAFLSAALKDNKFLSYGFMTGTYRIIHDEILSGLNNIIINTIFESPYNKFFDYVDCEKKRLLYEKQIPGGILNSATDDIKSMLHQMCDGKTIITKITPVQQYRNIINNPMTIFDLLLDEGYLKVVNKTILPDGDYLCELTAWNYEMITKYMKLPYVYSY